MMLLFDSKRQGMIKCVKENVKRLSGGKEDKLRDRGKCTQRR